jgi:hypothetical protein
MSTASVEPHYQRYQPGEGSLAVRLSGAQRRKLYELFVESCTPREGDEVIDVGVTADRAYAMNNYFEYLYPHKHRITATGVEPESDLPARYPGLKYAQVTPGRIPFPDGAFDIVHSSAVIEHVGSRERQAEFLSELWRISRRALFVTTPNRWFPIEFHTVLPFVHWLPAAAFRPVLRALGRDFYAAEENLNLLDRRALLKMAQQCGMRAPHVYGAPLFGWESNLALVAIRQPVGTRTESVRSSGTPEAGEKASTANPW